MRRNTTTLKEYNFGVLLIMNSYFKPLFVIYNLCHVCFYGVALGFFHLSKGILNLGVNLTR